MGKNNVMENSTITPILEDIIYNKVAQDTNLIDSTELIYDALHLLLNGDFDKFVFDKNIISNTTLFPNTDDSDFQQILSKINEKQSGRKKMGRFYTPKDVTEYIVLNTFLNSINYSITNIYSVKNILDQLKKVDENKVEQLLFEFNVFDPSSGAGEFLVTALETKLKILENCTLNLNDDIILSILKTIKGNDINETSIEITKIRLFFIANSNIQDKTKLKDVATILNKNFYVSDYLEERNLFQNNNLSCKFPKCHIIVGNPPYVEDRSLENKPTKRYGNIYANFLENSADLLEKNGVMGFVLPLSFVSTPRMSKIRNVLYEKCPKQLIANYADRPGCLFSGVHQKLNILICSNQSSNKKIYTSGYNYWNKNERSKLLSNLTLFENKFHQKKFIPKLSNALEANIFNKIFTENKTNSILGVSNMKKDKSLYLNMRACFWIKAFTFNPGSNEYKKFNYGKEHYYYILAILNSSLFFFHWIVVSDCWHITNKELDSFNVILNDIDFKGFEKLARKLEQRLEETKVYIGSKQTDYIYQHKLCKKEIDLIDDKLAAIYGLSKNELKYIKNYHYKYRMSEV